ncbi:predicted protein [Postia placenta Mad-698-R]|uniref:CCHC-type domain-containing protein n=1 Tax=Postia placenta MAD-698-R-SB12 TaxID=670580 RepID=A0A1X6MJ47_9APHY|nr:hypothetical protein POSPLADRAFT_1050680 [Postia placenta MAD-698-R-SB12]EED78303.1 predicted protein [Postia placenta Mad-698-R]OSX56467.1 hypothetical protein POSPLADRAFT_1050680 [Postia placenta MAD-698-R-SB12]
MTRLELKWQVTTGSIIGSNLAATSSATAFVTKSHGNSSKPRKTCSNCNMTGHEIADCFQLGGAMEGKCAEVLTTKCPCLDKGKSGGSKVLHDPDGRMFMLSNTGDTMYIDTTASMASSSAAKAPSTKFASLTVDTPDPVDLWAFPTLSPADTFKYSTLTRSLTDEDTASVDWGHHSSTASVTALATAAPAAAAALGTAPFFFDFSASTHLSPCKDNFSDLVAIAPHGIRGINGSVIYMHGVSTIVLAIPIIALSLTWLRPTFYQGVNELCNSWDWCMWT